MSVKDGWADSGCFFGCCMDDNGCFGLGDGLRSEEGWLQVFAPAGDGSFAAEEVTATFGNVGLDIFFFPVFYKNREFLKTNKTCT